MIMNETNPCYGTISFNRAQGNGMTLFGSNIMHDHCITLEVYHASVDRELHSDFIHEERPIVKVDMSYNQFAEAISAFGRHPGVPCTIRYTEKDGYLKELPTYVNKRKQLDKELKEQIDKITNIATNAEQRVNDVLNKKGTLTKADKDEIRRIMISLKNAMPNTEYIHKQFQNEMDKAVLEAKSEVEAFVSKRFETIAKETISQSDNPVATFLGTEFTDVKQIGKE